MSELFDVHLQLHYETEKAVLVSDDGDEKRAKWLPKSQLEINERKNNVLDITMPMWLAEKNGFV